MREIKFRGQRDFRKKWVYGLYVQDSIMGEMTHIIQTKDNILTKEYVEHEIDPNTVGQYTGLKDKNGVEIYEDDRVRVFGGECYECKYEYDFIGVIKWQGIGFDVVKDGVGQGFGYYDHDENIEVIGNIHELDS